VQASKLADGLRTEPSAVFTGLIAKAGALTVTNLLDYEKVPTKCAPFSPSHLPCMSWRPYVALQQYGQTLLGRLARFYAMRLPEV